MKASQTHTLGLLPAYLVVGEDELKAQTTVKRLHARLEKMGDLSFNSDFFSGENASGSAIVAAANTLPFASPFRLVQITDAEKLKKVDTELLVDYLKNPSETTILLVVAKKLAKNTKLYKALASIGPKAVIDCAPVARKDLNSLVRQMAQTHGISITPGGAATLIDLVGTNTVTLDNNLNKIALAHRGSDSVNESEVLANVARTSEVKPWEFVDAFSARNVSRCVILLDKMESTSPHALLSMCVTRIRELLITQSLMKSGRAAELPTKLKVPSWRVKNHSQWAKNYTPVELQEAIRFARDTEQRMKSGSNPDSEFYNWMINVLTTRKRS